MSTEQAQPLPPYPLHPSIEARLDPTYKEFYNTHIQNVQQVHHQPISVSRGSGILIPGGGSKLPVGSTVDYSVPRVETLGPEIKVRVFTPDEKEEARPADGWPVMVYFHGGGWVLGNIETENTVCSHLCSRGRCVVVSVDYRLAPEDPYPAAVHDCWEALLWVFDKSTVSQLVLNPGKAAVGGSSAGGNLAAIMCHKALASSTIPRFLAQLLIVPVTDNTATGQTQASWAENEHTPALPAAKMLWYRKHYLPDVKTWGEPEASPLLYAAGEAWEQQPPALVVVGELDVLRSEGEAYASKLREHGISVDLKIMKGMPHPFLAMDAALQQGRDTITFMCEALKKAFV
ncbi:triacylglycerol lipase [Phlyctema vagabunda]|uniref:Triacylglycerol lipase n=1 Tax=Phlyctema vagabunda TaxID=108571 RepID=A0ABR4PEM8_9HELO